MARQLNRRQFLELMVIGGLGAACAERAESKVEVAQQASREFAQFLLSRPTVDQILNRPIPVLPVGVDDRNIIQRWLNAFATCPTETKIKSVDVVDYGFYMDGAVLFDKTCGDNIKGVLVKIYNVNGKPTPRAFSSL